MNRRLILTAGLITAVLLLVLAWSTLPRVVAALPARIQGRLPEEILVLISTPLPTALPAPLTGPLRGTPDIFIPAVQPAAVDSQPGVVAAKESQPVTPVGQLPPTLTAPVATATQTATPSLTPTSTRRPLPLKARIDGLEIIAQKFNNCGPANLTMALNYYGLDVDQLAVGTQLKPNADDRNVSPQELVDYVNEQTHLMASAYSGGDMALLKRLIAAGFPVIIEKGLVPSEWQGWMGHYLTIVGYDDDLEEFYSLDTFLGPWDSSGRADSYETIAELWSHFNYTFVVVFPAEDQRRVEKTLGSEMLDPLTMWRNAALRAQAAIEEEPADAFAWFNLGTSLLHLGEQTADSDFFDDAASAYDHARELGLPWRMLWYQFGPYVAYLASGRIDDVLELAGAMLTSGGGQNVEETHLYLGHALLSRGDRNAAELAYRRALRLNPNYELGRQALDAVTGAGDGAVSGD